MPQHSDLQSRFELRQLQHFLVVYRCQNYSDAAFELGLSQQAISSSIKNLEKNLSSILFTRGRHGAMPTAEGHAFLHHANLILEDVNAAYEQVSRLGRGQSGSIRIGIADDPFGAVAARAIVKLQQERPDVTPHIVQDLNFRLRQQLIDGMLDLVCAAPNKIWRTDRHMVVENLDKSYMAVLCGNNHPLAQKARVTFSDLRDYPWIYSSDRVKSTIEDLFLEHAVDPPRSFIMVDGPSTLTMTLIAMGFHLLVGNSKSAESSWGKSVFASLPLEIEPGIRHGCMAHRKSAVDSEVRTYLMALIRTCSKPDNG
jgi:DNA-binding transcriptional LysR family regulator